MGQVLILKKEIYSCIVFSKYKIEARKLRIRGLWCNTREHKKSRHLKNQADSRITNARDLKYGFI